MSDTLTDLSPLQADFDPAERPTAAKLSNWAAQIETGFNEVQRLMGDLFHEQEANLETTFITNLNRALGNLGLAQWRLPTTQVFTWRQTLTAGRVEHLLDFVPQNAGAGTFAATAEGSVVLANYVASRTSLAAAGQWTREGRLLLTWSICGGGTVDYVVDPETFFEHHGALNGPNVVPHPAQIDENYDSVGAAYRDILCSIVDNGGGSYTFNLPQIRYWRDWDETLFNFGSYVQGAIPTYEVPGYFAATVANGGLGLQNGDEIPEGLIKLWFVQYDAGGNIVDIDLVRNVSTNDPLVFEYEDLNTFHVQIPSGMAPLTVPANPARNYVVTFGGVSASEVLRDLIHAMAQHDHSGNDGSGLLSHEDLLFRFDPATFIHSRRIYNPHPQYLERLGFNATDATNGMNSMVGNLHLGSMAAAGGLSQANNFAANDSYRLLLGPAGNSEGIYFDFDVANVPEAWGPGASAWVTHSLRPEWHFQANADNWLMAFGKDPADPSLAGFQLSMSTGTRRLHLANLIAADASSDNVALSSGVLQARDGILYMSGASWPGTDVSVPAAGADYIRYSAVAGTFTFAEDDTPEAAQIVCGGWDGAANRHGFVHNTPIRESRCFGWADAAFTNGSSFSLDTDMAFQWNAYRPAGAGDAESLTMVIRVALPDGARLRQIWYSWTPGAEGDLTGSLWTTAMSSGASALVGAATEVTSTGAVHQEIGTGDISGSGLIVDNESFAYWIQINASGFEAFNRAQRVQGVQIDYDYAALRL